MFSAYELRPHIEVPVPEFALVFHRTRSGYELTRHAINTVRSVPTLGAATPFLTENLAQLVDILKQQSNRRTRQLLPENVILTGHDEIAWWVPGYTKPMWFQIDNRTICIKVPWPPLLFHAKSGSLSVAALADAQRPGAKTKLYHAPIMNVYAHGGVCLGSAPRPESSDVVSMPGWEDAVFKTLFTHTNHKRTLRVGKTDVSNTKHLQIWRELAKQKAGEFPRELLVPMKKTVMEFLGDV